ncbi:hypothetical protein K432DRAFT_397252 [Lepidopterella palustris CBS 459.81]|uniref:Uncharacterized protein n=1 Tax=Lepidopterella palustris CBS 459.81 TaxID=1314670 RepID=A0A8E2E1H8_9PEZI|nr:hypothetical protein K432DRAFT_397252 [Lepidopterella palustris CBS 459.81]
MHLPLEFFASNNSPPPQMPALWLVEAKLDRSTLAMIMVRMGVSGKDIGGRAVIPELRTENKTCYLGVSSSEHLPQRICPQEMHCTWVAQPIGPSPQALQYHTQFPSVGIPFVNGVFLSPQILTSGGGPISGEASRVGVEGLTMCESKKQGGGLIGGLIVAVIVWLSQASEEPIP